MTCASCVANVESALRGVSGVKSADVNLATERASVQLDPTRADMPALVRAVERAGYGALALSGDQKERAAVEDQERAARRAQLVSLRRRLIVAAVLGSLTMILSMADLVISGIEHEQWRAYLMFALATPVQLWAAAPFYVNAWGAARHRQVNMNTLIVVGTTAAYGISVARLPATALFDASRAASVTSTTRHRRRSSRCACRPLSSKRARGRTPRTRSGACCPSARNQRACDAPAELKRMSRSTSSRSAT